MQIFFGEQCPCYSWVKASNGHPCERCRGCEAFYPDSVECRYSKDVPVGEPKYAIGQELYYMEMGDFITHDKVRKIGWDGFEWTYTLGRQRHTREEHTVYGSRQDADMALIQHKASILKSHLEDYSKRYNVPLSDLQTKLLPKKED